MTALAEPLTMATLNEAAVLVDRKDVLTVEASIVKRNGAGS
jgi:hypothetical protein